VLLIKIKLSIS